MVNFLAGSAPLIIIECGAKQAYGKHLSFVLCSLRPKMAAS